MLPTAKTLFEGCVIRFGSCSAVTVGGGSEDEVDGSSEDRGVIINNKYTGQ